VDLVFCGTPQFAVPALAAVVDAGHAVKLVVCKPDRPSGRGHELSVPAVKQEAQALGLAVGQPDKIRENAGFRTRLEEIAPQAIVVVAYGRIIPAWMLALPPHGNLNVHASLLPKYRGAAPIQWAIARGEKTTGVSIMQLDEGLDTGPVFLQKELAIQPEDTAVTLSPRLAALGAALLVETLRQIEAGARPRPQEHSRATLAPLLKKEDGRVDFCLFAETIANRLRGFQPWPGAYTRFRGKHLQIIRAAVATAGASPAPAELLVRDRQLLAGCASGSGLELLELQLEGKKRMGAAEFINGYHLQSGERLGA